MRRQRRILTSQCGFKVQAHTVELQLGDGRGPAPNFWGERCVRWATLTFEEVESLWTGQ
jgi:hypothetical protein